MARTPVSHAEVFQYLSKANKYAEGCSDARKRSIRRFAGNIALENGTLFYLSKDKGQIHKRRWISDKKVQQEIIESVHDNVAGGCHFGRDKSREKIVRRYFWHGQYEDVDSYIQTCETCQKVKHQVYSG